MVEQTRAIWELAFACLALCGVLVISACNHVFYQPSDQVFLEPDKLSKSYEKIWITARSETRLAGWVIPAKETAFGTVLHFHGNAQNMTSHFLFVHWLTDAGFNVVVFDYRGYGASEGEPSRQGLVEDGRAAIDWVRNHPKYGKDGLFILAQSLGGNVAVPSLVRAGEAGVRGLILDSTFTSYRDVTRAKLGELWLTWPLQWPLAFLVSDELSLDQDVGRLSIPILLVHARNDPVVPYFMSEQILKMINSSDRQFWRLKRGGHTAAFRDLESPFLPKLVAYLCERSSRPAACGENRIAWEKWLAQLIETLRAEAKKSKAR